MKTTPRPSTVEISRQLARQAAALLEWWNRDATDEPDILARIKAGSGVAKKLRAALARRRR